MNKNLKVVRAQTQIYFQRLPGYTLWAGTDKNGLFYLVVWKTNSQTTVARGTYVRYTKSPDLEKRGSAKFRADRWPRTEEIRMNYADDGMHVGWLLLERQSAPSMSIELH